MELSVIPNPNEIVQWKNDVDHDRSSYEAEDYAFARMRMVTPHAPASSAEQLKDFDRLVRAMELCREAIQLEATNPRRLSTIEQKSLQMSQSQALCHGLLFKI
jgi:hypothetical protein